MSAFFLPQVIFARSGIAGNEEEQPQYIQKPKYAARYTNLSY